MTILFEITTTAYPQLPYTNSCPSDMIGKSTKGAQWKNKHTLERY